jgi:ABC-type glycerol-3-phosphate transport system substrate-binding protein
MARGTIDKTRRRCIKVFGGTAGLTALAGCSGDTGGGGGGTDTSGDGGGGTNTSADQDASGGSSDGDTSTSTSSQQGGTDLSGVTINYWDMHNVNSEPVRSGMEDKVASFEEETGANMKVNWSDQGSVAGGKWLQNMRAGEVPHLYSSSSAIDGQFIASGYVEPAGNYVGEFSQEFNSSIEFTLNRLESVYGGYSDDIYEIPISQLPSNPFVIRTDHAEQAGIDLEKDFPPENYEQLLQVGKQLQEEGPSKFGFQVHGAGGDVTDEITTVWATAEGGFDGTYINEDWTDVNYDKDVWIEALSRQVEIYREHGLSDEGTPSSSDERASKLLMSGDASMSQINAQNFAMFQNQAPELVKNGDIQFGQAWKGEAGYRGTGFIAAFGLCKPTSSANQEQWNAAQAGGRQFMQSFIQPEWQKEWARIFGHVPARQDIWEEVPEVMPNEEEVQFGEAIIKNAKDLGPAWAAHPQLPFIKASAPGAPFQKALSGDISAEEACNQAAQTVREQTKLGQT